MPRVLPLLLLAALALPAQGGPLRPSKKDQPATHRTIGQGRSALRHDLLDAIRTAADDPATCFQDPDYFDAHRLQPEQSEAEIQAMLDTILLGLRAHEQERIEEASQELLAEQAAEVDYFGSADHHMHPSTDLYEDPLKAYRDRPDLMLDQVDPRDFDYPIVLNERVQDWMVYLLTRGRRYFVKWIARSERYKPVILPRLREAGLPEDLLYQAMIESGFNPYATSRASAVGVWQFIRSTGTAFGLTQDYWLDERRDPVEATDAAVAYMARLHRRFGDWKLASAAYNAGPGKIGKAINMYGTDDFWELAASHRTYLKPETKNYVPKIMAAAILAKYADRYGLTDDIEADHWLPEWNYDRIAVPEATDLRVVAKLAGVELEALEFMNPQLRRGFTPPGVANYPLNVPAGTGKKVDRELAALPKKDRMTFVQHRVRRGDSINALAGRYGVPASSITQMNNIDDPHKLRVGQELLIPVRAEAAGSRELKHVVTRGESLSVIAVKYSTTVEQLKQANKLSSDSLRIGQELVVHGVAPAQAASKGSSSGATGGSSNESRSSESRSSKPSTSTYTVQAGDSLSEIAEAHGMRTSELKSLNKLSGDTIRVGQKLTVQGGAKATVSQQVYVVKSGDSLYLIARKHGVSVDDLQRWNSLRGDTIQPGQKLVVRAARRVSAR